MSNKTRQGWRTGLLSGQVIIVDKEYAIGPFQSTEEALDWLATHTVGAIHFVVRLHPYAGLGNSEVAHHCGIVSHSAIQEG